MNRCSVILGPRELCRSTVVFYVILVSREGIWGVGSGMSA